MAQVEAEKKEVQDLFQVEEQKCAELEKQIQSLQEKAYISNQDNLRL